MSRSICRPYVPLPSTTLGVDMTLTSAIDGYLTLKRSSGPACRRSIILRAFGRAVGDIRSTPLPLRRVLLLRGTGAPTAAGR